MKLSFKDWWDEHAQRLMRHPKGTLRAVAQEAWEAALAQQAQPEMPTREMAVAALRDLDARMTAAELPTRFDQQAAAVLALFAPKEQRCKVCDWSTDDANTHPDYDHDFQVSQ